MSQIVNELRVKNMTSSNLPKVYNGPDRIIQNDAQGMALLPFLQVKKILGDLFQKNTRFKQ